MRIKQLESNQARMCNKAETAEQQVCAQGWCVTFVVRSTSVPLAQPTAVSCVVLIVLCLLPLVPVRAVGWRRDARVCA
jgi:hypothetical protein